MWYECEATDENGVITINSCVPITPEKEYEDFMARSSEIKEIIFNGYLSNYCIMDAGLPAFIKRICREKNINFHALKKDYRVNHRITKFKF